jgi:hypothetical protein
MILVIFDFLPPLGGLTKTAGPNARRAAHETTDVGSAKIVLIKDVSKEPQACLADFGMCSISLYREPPCKNSKDSLEVPAEMFAEHPEAPSTCAV